MKVNRPTAMLIDKDTIALNYFQQELERLGFEVNSTDNITQDNIESQIPQAPNLLVMDLENLEIDERSFIQAFDETQGYQHTPILIANKTPYDSFIRRGFDTGVVEYISKPIDRTKFAMTVNTLMGWNTRRRLPKRAPALIVEDIASTAAIIEKLFNVMGVDSIICKDLNEFKHHLDVIFPEIISLDLQLPDGNGLDVCREMRASSKLDELPIVVVSSHSEKDTIIDCLKNGANDFISKPIIKEEFFARVSNILKIRRLQTELREKQNELENLAFTDSLTTLFNRAYMNQALKREAERSRRTGQPLGLLIIDLDFFKQVNDVHGHELGDVVLKEFSELLRNNIRSYDVPCRFGGEEFCVLLPGSTSSNVITVAERIRKNCAAHLFSEKQLEQTISIGASVFPEISTEFELIGDADKALYNAKRSGRNKTILAVHI